MVPIVISHMGVGGFGIWSIILNAVAYMRFGSIGIKSAFQKYVAEATAVGNFDRVSRLLSTGCAGMLILSLVGLVPISMYSRSLVVAAGFPSEFLVPAERSVSMLAVTMVIANAGAAYEAIVMGGHRIDLARKFNTYLSVAEAFLIIVVLDLGYGLFAMASVMALSELAFIVCCARAAREVMPDIDIGPRYVTRSVLPELVKFAGSYQLVSLLQILYGAIAPIAILRAFGATASGMYALVGRLMSPIGMFQSAFMIPVLSGAAMIFATGSSEKIHALVSKSFKITFGTTLIPLAMISVFGKYAIEAWTGQSDPRFGRMLWIMSFAGLFQGLSLLGLVLYRASGRSLMDNIRESSRIAVAIGVALFATRLGIYGVLAGLAFAELCGVVVMAFAMSSVFRSLRLATLLLDAMRVTGATIGIVTTCALAALAFPGSFSSGRFLAIVRLAAVCGAGLLSLYPALYFTGAISRSEIQSLVDSFKKKSTRVASTAG
jgi:O-antigen/teichoic acid export membrane protein